jgi:phage host-nuclease inhibitor protein Gam
MLGCSVCSDLLPTNINVFSFTELARGVLAELGEKDGGKVRVRDGRFGIYINWKKVNAKMPSQYMDNPSELPLDEAWSLIEEKAATMPGTTGNTKKGKSASGAASVDLPPAPKRPLSAYLHFCAEKRPRVAETLKSLGEVSKELARLWAETSDKDRETYTDLAVSSKVEYDEKKTLWNKECDEILKKNGTKQSGKTKGSRITSIKGSTSPTAKRPKSAYIYFCAAKRPEVSEQFKSLGDISKEIARQWAEITPEERKEFDAKAATDKVRYEDEKIGGASAGSAIAKKARSVIKTAKTATTKKRGPSAYMLFCAEHRESIIDEDGNKLPLGQTTKRLAQMWKECHDDARAPFDAEAAKQKELLAV